ncbi:MAG TPA: hypothetical protein VFE50_24855 [Cyclobacteriaceae bacterium]|nr:hypothetical protein [Cyclobacteriaceae bacterium]
MKTPLIILALLISFAALSQNTNTSDRKVEPKGGVAAVAIVYYKLDFIPEEVEYLRTHEAELIFLVDEKGKAVLEKVNNIEMRSIVDVMMLQNESLPEFYPEVVNGVAQSSVYFMKVRWPQYQVMQPAPYMYPNNQTSYVGRKLDEFEYVNYQGTRFDMMMGGAGNMLAGDAAEFNKGGGGFKMDFEFYGKRGWGGGVVTLFHGNSLKKEYPLTTPLRQTSSRFLMFAGLVVGKLFKETPRGQFIAHLEFCYTSQTIVTVDPQLKNQPVLAQGLSPGVVMNYALNLGKGRMSHYYYFPTAYRGILNLHLAVRPMIMDLPQASGYLIEGGVGFRLSLRSVSDFKLR